MDSDYDEDNVEEVSELEMYINYTMDEIIGGGSNILEAGLHGKKVHLHVSQLENSPYSILRPHQKSIIDRVIEITQKTKGAYIIVPTGFGKTYIMGCLGYLYNTLGVLICIIAPKSTHHQIEVTFDKLNVPIQCILAYGDSGMKNKLILLKQLGGHLVILADEAHHFIQKSGGDFKDILVVMRLATVNGALYLFTATPVHNHLADLSLAQVCWTNERILEMSLKLPHIRDDFDTLYKSDDSYDFKKLGQILCNTIIYDHVPVDSPDEAPLVIQYIPMDKGHSFEHYDSITPLGIIKNVTKLVTVMLNSELGLTKLQALRLHMDNIQHPIVIYSAYIGKLDTLISDSNIFKEGTIYCANKIKGEKDIRNNLDMFNNPDNVTGNILKAFAIGPGMSEGIEFTYPQTLIYLSPPDSLVTMIQSVGRLKRPHSLTHLKPEDRIINVIAFVGVYHPEFLDSLSTDDSMYLTNDQYREDKMKKLKILNEWTICALTRANSNKSFNGTISGGSDTSDPISIESIYLWLTT